jgi:hypothetical protein
MLPKSKRRAYVGFDDGTNVVKYYNAETCKVLTSRNYRNLNPPTSPTPDETIEVTPDVQREGESGGNTLQPGITGSKDLDPEGRKRKQNSNVGDVDINEPRKTRGKRTNYRFLQDPFPDEEEDNETFLMIEEVYAIIAGDELTSLEEVRNSPEWPQWKNAMQEEMDLLKEKGTYIKVQKPPDAVPLANKWVFIQKISKEKLQDTELV